MSEFGKILLVVLGVCSHMAVAARGPTDFQFWSGAFDYEQNKLTLALDTLLIAFAVYVLLRRPDKPEKPLSEKEIQMLIDDWTPEPLFPKLDERKLQLGRKIPSIQGSNGTHVKIDGKEVISLARTNFLGMICNKEVEESAIKALYKYGTGTCGPRGFYGTIDVHLKLEQRIRDFMKSDDCLIYAYGFATVSSAIPAFSGRGDLLIVDKGVSYPLQTGIKLSRSDVVWFEHNDMNDLEKKLQKVASDDKRTGRKITRRFIVVEGLYQNYGDFAPLNKIMEFKKKYCYRLILDDSYAIGSCGATGRGTCEIFGVNVKDVEILTGSLESSVSSVGGFCCGSKSTIFHQRLNAAGYVFSASLPPLLTTAAHTAFDIVDKNPELIADLARKTKILIDGLSNVQGMKLRNQSNSPVIHLELKNRSKDRIDEDEVLQEIVDEALKQGVQLTRAMYVLEQESYAPPPSIRIYATAALSEQQLQNCISVIQKSAAKVLNASF